MGRQKKDQQQVEQRQVEQRKVELRKSDSQKRDWQERRPVHWFQSCSPARPAWLPAPTGIPCPVQLHRLHRESTEPLATSLPCWAGSAASPARLPNTEPRTV